MTTAVVGIDIDVVADGSTGGVHSGRLKYCSGGDDNSNRGGGVNCVVPGNNESGDAVNRKILFYTHNTYSMIN